MVFSHQIPAGVGGDAGEYLWEGGSRWLRTYEHHFSALVLGSALNVGHLKSHFILRMGPRGRSQRSAAHKLLVFFFPQVVL